MRTTLDLPDELFRQLKAKAALQGAKLKDLLTRYVETGLRQSVPQLLSRSKLPVIKGRGTRVVPNLTAQRQSKLEEKDDLAKLSRSFRR